MPGLRIRLRRGDTAPLTAQISDTIAGAIREGRLAPGARLPSWRDLATQLGVARGTVRAAYERLSDELLVVASGPAGTHVAEQVAGAPRSVHAGRSGAGPVEVSAALRAEAARFPIAPLPFMTGVPAQDAFPAKLWTRVVARAARAEAEAAALGGFPDPRGTRELREQLAGYLALARGIRCAPEQIVITGGYRDGLHLAILALGTESGAAWIEEPGFYATRRGLALAGMRPVPVSVDAQGLRVADGIAAAPDAALAVVTAGQQAPLGVALSSARRHALLRWAARGGSWIVEDDYLSELQLRGRAAPALASMDPAGRVIYIGSFSKTMAPALRVGFVVAPPAMAPRFSEIAANLVPAPSVVVQLALAEFLREGHYLRHLRRMKRLYAARRDALCARLAGLSGVEAMAGLAVLLRLPPGTDDVALVRRARSQGISPTPLSIWYATDAERIPGLLLSVTNLVDPGIDRACDRLRSLIGAG